MTSSLSHELNENLENWLKGEKDPQVIEQIQQWKDSNSPKLADAFYKRLEFGTGGIRALVGIGSAQLNDTTLALITQGLANHLKESFPNKRLSVVIGYDVRTHSKGFAQIAAQTLAANQIHVKLFDDIAPTPLVSFTARKEQADAAIMITASHNPPQYNGYKVYNHHGGQVVAPQDKAILKAISEVKTLDDVKPFDEKAAPIDSLKQDSVELYLNYLKTLQPSPKGPSPLKLIYSALHGTGCRVVPPALKLWGFSDLELIQKNPDGLFPTAPSPNPEDLSALEQGMALLEKEQADLLLANDPDCDRMGAMALHQGQARYLSGNHIAALIFDHLCREYDKNKKWPRRPAIIKSFVTTELLDACAKAHKVEVYSIAPGFKYIAQMMEQWESHEGSPSFIFGAEESLGYLIGHEIRDKDGCLAGLLLADAARSLKRHGKTLIDRLNELYKLYGYHHEQLINLKFAHGKEGNAALKALMQHFREEPPKTLKGLNLEKVEDLSPASNVLIWQLKAEDIYVRVTLRPSGTEPKLKIYLALKGEKEVVQELAYQIELELRALAGIEL